MRWKLRLPTLNGRRDIGRIRQLSFSANATGDATLSAAQLNVAAGGRASGRVVAAAVCFATAASCRLQPFGGLMDPQLNVQTLARPRETRVTDETEWWIDEPSLPDVIWARLQVLPEGSAVVTHANGRTQRFGSVRAARDALLEDEFVRPSTVDPDDLARLGILEAEIQPPSGEGAQLLSRMSRVLDCADALRDLAAVTWQKPWTILTPAEHDLALTQLRRELDPKHVLYGRPARPLLKRIDRDDVLCVMSSPVQLAVVHLTYTSSVPERPPLPTTTTYDRVWEFVDRTHQDAAEYEAG